MVLRDARGWVASRGVSNGSSRFLILESTRSALLSAAQVMLLKSRIPAEAVDVAECMPYCLHYKAYTGADNLRGELVPMRQLRGVFVLCSQ